MKKRRRKGKTTKSILDRLDRAITIVEVIEGYSFSEKQQNDLNETLDVMYDAHARLLKFSRILRALYAKKLIKNSPHPCGRAILRAYRKMKGEKKK